MLLLISGRVKVAYRSAEGKVLLLAVRGERELLGSMGVLTGRPRSASVIAMRECVTRTLMADRFRSLTRGSDLEAELLQGAFARITEGEAWRADIAGLAAGPRLARALLRLAGPGDGGGPVGEVHLSQTEIGQAIGLSRAVVAGELAGLRRAGVVVTENGRVLIIDPSMLRKLAGSGHGAV
ncbi:Crp/Fnr family transcriptional regulator [Actinocorallia longicatena]|uniref:Crp/Fnr family transcriptional regulator n=1 Tax=Actinocorallia longicatena TaxID=111803 RepID=UPI0031DE4471